MLDSAESSGVICRGIGQQLNRFSLVEAAECREAQYRYVEAVLSFEVIGFMSIDSSDCLFLGIDVGGTNIKAGLVADDGTVLSRSSVSTGATNGPDHGVQQMAKATDQALKQAEQAWVNSGFTLDKDALVQRLSP